MNDVVSLQLLGPDGTLVAQADSLPAGGKVLTTTWPPNAGLVDRIPLRIPAIGPSPARDHLAVYFYPLGHPNQRVQSVNAAGQVDPIPEIGLLTVKSTTPYTILAEHRPDVLRFYAANGWDTQTEGRQIFDNWLQHGPDGGEPTTASAYVKARGWASTTVLRPVSLRSELFDQRQ